MTARNKLRIRRFLDGALVDERELGRGGLGSGDAEWAMLASEAGLAWRIVIDDPAADIDAIVVLQGGQVCDHAESLYGRCVACGMTWEEQQRRREVES
jgi:hypothetical protein